MRPTSHSPVPFRSVLVLVESFSCLLSGGCKNDRKGTHSLADVVSVSLSYPFSMDASVRAHATQVTVGPSGDATCSGVDSAGVLWKGELPASDTTIPDLLSRPGLLHDLATWCTVNRTDTGPYIVTRFVNDDTAYSRLVETGCTNDNLDALVQALERIGDACIAAASTYFNPPDGGNLGGLYNLARGPCCYKVTAVRDVSDGCERGVADTEGQFVQGNYTQETAIFILGDQGAWGQGQVGNNYGLLTREGDTSDPTVAACTWHQRVDTMIVVIGAYTFTASVVEQRTNIAPACGVSATSCTSSWTWYLGADGTKSPTNNCQ